MNTAVISCPCHKELTEIKARYRLVEENFYYFGQYTSYLRRLGIISSASEHLIHHKLTWLVQSFEAKALRGNCPDKSAEEAMRAATLSELRAHGITPNQLIFRPIHAGLIFQPY